MDFFINDEVKLNFSDTHLNVTGTESEISIPLDQFVSMTHNYDPSSVDGIAEDLNYRLDGDTILFYNLPAGSVINVHTLAGSLISSKEAAGDETISLSELTTGIYIVSVNGISIKVSIK